MASIKETTTTVVTSRPTEVPTVHDAGSRTQEQLLSRLLEFNKNVEHVARVEQILMRDLGLSKEDADVFIRAGVDAVFGKVDQMPGYVPKSRDVMKDNIVVGYWMNELREDFNEATFVLKKTKSVFVSFEGTKIRIRRPEKRVVKREAFYDEEPQDINAIKWREERVYDLLNSDVFLLPLDVPVKIRWLARFPIAIKLKLVEAPTSIIVEADKKNDRLLQKDESTLILFARCDREKEELFWKFMSCSGKTPYRLNSTNFTVEANPTPFNTFVQRVLADFPVDPIWKEIIQEKISAKLQQIKKPHYLEDLKVTDLVLGKSPPKFGVFSDKVGVDRLGIWLEVDFEMHNPVCITLTTNLNAFKMSHPEDKSSHSKSAGETAEQGKEQSEADKKELAYSQLNALYGQYEEDEFDEDPEMPEAAKPKLLRVVEGIAESKIFKYFSEIGFVRKALEDVTDIDLMLTVDVELIKGRIAVNLPHPPSDRMWYGFVPTPTMKLKVLPHIGKKDIDMTMVTDWLEKTVVNAFHQVLTIPNMDDITVPFANSGIDPDEYRRSKLRDLVLKLT
ncbi:hypothetical protein RvY_13997 [Ramazzottius varieornatus]|uniref:SMP-LTD domain-containing protein n=1 Tax=Ramazzottius varieornatus TaxID=947166 RepID=A0A1D1VRK0_RAMVA|nr:hypothetical protein RvY_13997 [Ramazzottius varieornatus]